MNICDQLRILYTPLDRICTIYIRNTVPIRRCRAFSTVEHAFLKQNYASGDKPVSQWPSHTPLAIDYMLNNPNSKSYKS